MGGEFESRRVRHASSMNDERYGMRQIFLANGYTCDVMSATRRTTANRRGTLLRIYQDSCRSIRQLLHLMKRALCANVSSNKHGTLSLKVDGGSQRSTKLQDTLSEKQRYSTKIAFLLAPLKKSQKSGKADGTVWTHRKTLER